MLDEVFPEKMRNELHFSLEDMKELFKELDCGSGLVVTDEDIGRFYNGPSVPLVPKCELSPSDEVIKKRCEVLVSEILAISDHSTPEYIALDKEYDEHCYKYPLTPSMAEELVKASRKLMRILNDDDTVVFLGRSPPYLKLAIDHLYALEGRERKWNSILINISGRPDDNLGLLKDGKSKFNYREVWDGLVTPNRYKVFTDYMDERGLETGSITGRLFLVDFTNTGYGLFSAAILFQRHLKVDPANIYGISMGSLPSDFYHGIWNGLHSYLMTDSFGVSLTVLALDMNSSIAFGNIRASHQYGHHFPPYKWTPECKKTVDSKIEPPYFSRLTWEELKQWLSSKDLKTIESDQLVSIPLRFRKDLVKDLTEIDERHRPYLRAWIDFFPHAVVSEKVFQDLKGSYKTFLIKKIGKDRGMNTLFRLNASEIYELDFSATDLGTDKLKIINNFRQVRASMEKIRVLRFGSNNLDNSSLPIFQDWIKNSLYLEELWLIKSGDEFQDQFDSNFAMELLQVFLDNVETSALKKLGITFKLPNGNNVTVMARVEEQSGKKTVKAALQFENEADSKAEIEIAIPKGIEAI